MNNRTIVPMLASVALLALGAGATVQAQQATMTFFLTSAGRQGADLGGLEGADRLCQQLAQPAAPAARPGGPILSTQASGGAQAVNARDRIGAGLEECQGRDHRTKRR
jgi:hypothetical protein